MHRARLAEEARSEALQHPIDGHQCLEEAGHGKGVVGPLALVLGERNRVLHFVGVPVEFWIATERAEEIEEPVAEICNAHRAETERGPAPIACGAG
jgi:hypothetical protein